MQRLVALLGDLNNFGRDTRTIPRKRVKKAG